LNLDQIEAFIYAAATGSFSKAGEMLFMSQPSVSTKIKSLEQQLGAPLFERTGKEIYLSEEGKAFLPYAEKISTNFQDGLSTIKKMDTSSQELSIAAVYSSVSYLLPKLINAFYRDHPNIKPIIYTGHSDQVLKMVLDHDVSLGIVRSLYHTKIESIPLMKDEMLLACHSTHPLSAKRQISLEEVSGLPFILFKHETFDWTLIHNAFERADIKPNVVMEVDSIEGAKQMVMENMGISFLPYFTISKELASKQLYTVDIKEFPTIKRNFDLITNPSNPFNSTTREFMQFIKKRFNN